MARSPADAPFLKTGLLHNANNNASSGSWRGLKSPSMVSHSKLSYLERVVLEIVESERMYVRDLRSIIEVSLPGKQAFLFGWGGGGSLTYYLSETSHRDIS